MMAKEKILAKLFAVLTEVKMMRVNGECVAKQNIYVGLINQLATLYEVLEEDVPEEYWEEIEELIY